MEVDRNESVFVCACNVETTQTFVEHAPFRAMASTVMRSANYVVLATFGVCSSTDDTIASSASAKVHSAVSAFQMFPRFMKFDDREMGPSEKKFTDTPQMRKMLKTPDF